MSQFFISYSRKDIAIAAKIIVALTRNGFKPWVDEKSIPKGEFLTKEIQHGIEASDIFLFLISPDSVQSEWCKLEITYAATNGKRILPIVIRDTNKEIIPKEVKERNWIFYRDSQDDFHKAISEIQKTIYTDYKWVKYHTELQVKALKWGREKDNSRLLRGKELQEAEWQLTESNSAKDPQPTDLQREYVVRSRKYANNTKRKIVWALAGITAIMLIFAIAAWQQTAQAIVERQGKEQQEKIVQANTLAEKSISLRDEDYVLSTLLGIAAFKIDDNPQTRKVILDNLDKNLPLSQHLFTNSQYGTSAGSDLAITSDGKILISEGTDSFIYFWDTNTYQLIGSPLNNEDYDEKSFAISPDNKILASGSCGKVSKSGGSCKLGKITFWDIQTRKMIGEPIDYSHFDIIESLDFSPDGKVLASGSRDKTVIIWDMETRQPIKRLEDHTDNITSVAFSPDGKLLAAGSWDHSIILWDTLNYQVIAHLPGTTDEPIECLKFSPDGKILAAGSWDNSVALWDVQTKKQLKQLTGHTNRVNQISFNTDGKKLVSGSSSGEIILWDIESGLPLSQLAEDQNGITDVIFIPGQDNTIISSNINATIAIWLLDLNQPLTIKFINDNNYKSNLLFTSSNNNTVLDGYVDTWGVTTDLSIKTYSNEVSITSSGRILKLTHEFGELISQTIEGEVLSKHDFTGDISVIKYNNDGTKAAIGVRNGQVLVWDIKANSLALLGSLNGIVSDIAFSHDGNSIAGGSDAGEIILWELGFKPSEISVYSGYYTIEDIIFSPDGKYIVASHARDLLLWNKDTREEKTYTLAMGTSALAFSPTNDVIASGNSRGEVLLWEVSDLQPINHIFQMPGGGVWNLEFSPDGKYLAAAGDGIIVWDVSLQSWLYKSCVRAGHNLGLPEWLEHIGGVLPYQALCPNFPLDPFPT